jgi:hypothetical protein
MTGSAKQSMPPEKKEWIASAFADQLRRTSRRFAPLRKPFAFVAGNDEASRLLHSRRQFDLSGAHTAPRSFRI